jgi:Domain of unknown function (DUF4010)
MVDMTMPPIELAERLALLPALAFLFVAGGSLAWWEWRESESRLSEELAIPATNPLQLTTALVFASLFLVVSPATAWVQSVFGQRGIFALAALFGASDIDPFVLGLAQDAATSLSPSALAPRCRSPARPTTWRKPATRSGSRLHRGAADGGDPGDPPAIWPRGSSRLPHVSGVTSIAKKGAQ